MAARRLALLLLLRCSSAWHATPRGRYALPRRATSDDLAELRVPELKDQCRALGLPVSGTKAVLIERILEADGAPARLRLQIDGGGCSGFEYKFEVERADAPVDEEDHVFTRDSSSVVVDDSSLEFVRGATIDFQQEMIRSAFAVVDNPNSESACGCGSSFALKNFESNPAID